MVKSLVRPLVVALVEHQYETTAAVEGGAEVTSGSGEGFTWGDGTTVEWSSE